MGNAIPAESTLISFVVLWIYAWNLKGAGIDAHLAPNAQLRINDHGPFWGLHNTSGYWTRPLTPRVSTMETGIPPEKPFYSALFEGDFRKAD